MPRNRARQPKIRRTIKQHGTGAVCGTPIVQASAPPQLIDGAGPPRPGRSHTGRPVADHQPLHRQAQIYEVSHQLHRSPATIGWGAPLVAVAALRLGGARLSHKAKSSPTTPRCRCSPPVREYRTGRLWRDAIDYRSWCGPAPPGSSDNLICPNPEAVQFACPNSVQIAVSAASRPRAMTMRPMRARYAWHRR